MKVNPFRPGSIVGPGMFAGRIAEMQTIDRGLYQTKHGNPWHFLLHGERGIGKSSLLLVTEVSAGGEVHAFEDEQVRFNFVTVSISLEPTDDYTDLIGKLGRGLSKQLGEREGLKGLLKSAWDLLSRWEVMGVKYAGDLRQPQPSEMLENLVDSFVRANSSLKTNIDGFLLLIDEADKGCKGTQLGEFIKVFTERLCKCGCNRVGMGLAGLTEVIGGLKQSHESSVRILHSMCLEPLLPDERLQVLRQGIIAANAKNKEQTVLRPDAAELISHLSEGYPHFIQQYAYSAFAADIDNDITLDDVVTGAYGEHGALDQLGTRYFEGMYSQEIDSDDYRRVLKVMAEHSGPEYISRKQIKEASGLKDTTLTNALKALSKRHIINRHREKSGLYKLPSGSFRAWIVARARKEKQQSLPIVRAEAPKDEPPF